MKFKSRVVEKAVVISISGDIISLYDSKELIETVEKALQENNRNIVFYLDKVNYINSAGINVLITVLTSVRNRGGELVLSSISDKVKSLLIITKLNSIFNVKDSVEESLLFVDELEMLSDQSENK